MCVEVVEPARPFMRRRSSVWGRKSRSFVDRDGKSEVDVRQLYWFESVAIRVHRLGEISSSIRSMSFWRTLEGGGVPHASSSGIGYCSKEQCLGRTEHQ